MEMPKSSKTPAQPSAAQRRKAAAKPAPTKDDVKGPAKPRASRAKSGNGAPKATIAPLDFDQKPVARPAPHPPASVAAPEVTDFERGLLGDLLAVIEEHSADAALEIDRDAVERAFVFACEHHADQLRRSGEDFIIHPVGVAKICAGMRLDTETLCAALLHDTVEDTSASRD